MQEEAPRERGPSRSGPKETLRLDLATVLAHTHDYVAVVDDGMRIRFTNRPPPGQATGDVVGTLVTRWMDARSHSVFTAAIGLALGGGEHPSFDAFEAGTGRAFQVKLWPVLPSDGSYRAVVVTAQDVTERRRREREMRRANRTLQFLSDLRGLLLEIDDEERLFESICTRTLLESGYTGMWIGTIERDELASIRHAASGGSLSDALRQGDVRAVVEPGAGERSPVAEAVDARAPLVLDEEPALRFMARLWGGDARTETRHVAVIPICDGPHPLAVGIVTSPHHGAFGGAERKILQSAAAEVARAMRWMRARGERRLLVEQLVQSQKMEAIGRIAAGIAHDFNNQLTSILGFADMLSVQLEDESMRDQAMNIVRAAERSAYLVAQLLAFARKGPFMQTSVDVRALLADLVAILERSFDKKVAVRCEWKANLRYVDGDAQQLENALLNLALNARDAMPSGGTIRFVVNDVDRPSHEVEGAPEAREGGFLSIAVIDEGVGMDEETKKRIFDPFFTTKPPGEGTGLGLSAVYGTVQRHRGLVEVESKPGQGSTFRLTFPARREPGLAPAKPLGRERELPARGDAKKRILVIDDEPLVGALVVSGLRGQGFEVEAAIAPEGGLARFEESPEAYDLVLLDLVMPRIGGAQIFHALRLVRPDVPVLLMSGYSIDHESEALLAQGAAGFLQKPFTVGSLLHRIREIFASREEGPSAHPS